MDSSALPQYVVQILYMWCKSFICGAFFRKVARTSGRKTGSMAYFYLQVDRVW